MIFIRIWILAGVLLAFSGCSRDNLYIDNAGKSLRKIEIDGQTFAMEPGSAMILKANKGTHKIKIMDENKTVLKDTVFTLNKGGLINLSNSRYVIWKDLYGDQIYRTTKLSEKQIEYGNWIFKGDFTELDSTKIFTEKTWDFDPDQPFPKDRIGWDLPNGEKYIIKSKLYRLEDFVKEVKKN
ncbi:MAG: hypothetical protein K1X92_08425 [Bacteroidia bacterium]|nr:hypothetical protein [Bacteroidia bacterium]